MRYLIACLGNIGDDYQNTRHNIGFFVADTLAQKYKASFELKRHAYISKFRVKNKILFVIKPTTLMNRSGLAVRYWLDFLQLPANKLLVVSDDIALPEGKIRLRPAGGDGGHNGLADIIEKTGTQHFARMRIGIGHGFPQGAQSQYVLGSWTDEQEKVIQAQKAVFCDAIKCFTLEGLNNAMTRYNS